MSRLTLAAAALLLAAAPALAQTSEDVEKQILKQSNAYRAKKDAGKLELDDKLSAVAQAHARAMAKADKYGDDDKNGHVWDGKMAGDRVKAAGYKFSYLGENVGWNQRKKDTADAIMKAWIDSPGHEKNLAHKDFTQTGIGAAKSQSGKWYFVHLFARPAGAMVKIAITLENATKVTIPFRIGKNKYQIKAGEVAKVNYSQSSGKVQIAITWPGSDEEELADLADKGSYVFSKKDKKYAFKKAGAK